MIVDFINQYVNLIDTLKFKYGINNVNHAFNIGTSGVYLLFCGPVDNRHNIYKPGITNTNIYKDKLNKTDKLIVDEVINFIKIHLNSTVKMSTEKNRNRTIEQQFNSRNGKITKNTNKCFTKYESKEHYLPVIARYKTHTLNAIVFENFITYINKYYQGYKDLTDLKFNHSKLYYNGYCYKAYYPTKSGNMTESKILIHNYKKVFNYIANMFNLIPLLPDDKFNEINEAKYKALHDYYNRVKKFTKFNDLRPDDHVRLHKNIYNINYNVEPLTQDELTIYEEWKKNKLTIGKINKNFDYLVVKCIGLKLIDFENSKIRKYN